MPDNEEALTPEQLKRKRVEACKIRIDEVLKEYNCGMHVEMVLSTQLGGPNMSAQSVIHALPDTK